MNRQHRARRLLDDSFVVDAHSDYAIQLYRERRDGARDVLRSKHLPELRAGGVNLEVLTVGGDFSIAETDLRQYETVLSVMEAVHCEIDEGGDDIVLIRSAVDFDTVAAQEAIVPQGLNIAQVLNAAQGVLLALEGVIPLGDDLARLHRLHGLGLRSVILTHDKKNLAAEGCHETGGGGLSDFGRRLVKEIESLNMLLDLVHVNERSFFDALERYGGPPVVSHSNARAVLDHPRNLRDEQIRAVAERGGVIGLNFLGMFITEHPSDASMDRLIDHADHIATVAGTEHICIGPDFADYFIDAMRLWLERENLPPETMQFVRGAETVAGLPVFVEGLLRRGYADEDIRNILGGNVLRVFRQVLS